MKVIVWGYCGQSQSWKNCITLRRVILALNYICSSEPEKIPLRRKTDESQTNSCDEMREGQK